MLTRLQHFWLFIRWLPWLVIRVEYRRLLGEMRVFCGRVPTLLQQPLPQAMQQIGQRDAAAPNLPEAHIRDLADLAALLERRSPLGLCLRRSLVRYHYLRPRGLPLELKFGAKLLGQPEKRGLTGHAWLTLNDQPYHEADANWQGFTVMYTYGGKETERLETGD
jgi:hypothetical protein